MHASWNALVSKDTNKEVALIGVFLGHTPWAIAVVLILPVPDMRSWLFILLGALLHLGYYLFLLKAYKIGEYTQVYPISRGTAPLLVAIISEIFLFSILSMMQWIAVLTIVLGIMSLGLVRSVEGHRNPKAVWMAITTGFFIGSYTLTDGIGARLSGSPVSFFAWLAIVCTLFISLYFYFVDAKYAKLLVKEGKQAFLIGGTISFIAYALVMWAYTLAPIALVSALRETSIVFALLIGTLILREKLNWLKIVATLITIFGAVLLRLS